MSHIRSVRASASCSVGKLNAERADARGGFELPVVGGLQFAPLVVEQVVLLADRLDVAFDDGGLLGDELFLQFVERLLEQLDARMAFAPLRPLGDERLLELLDLPLQLHVAHAPAARRPPFPAGTAAGSACRTFS